MSEEESADNHRPPVRTESLPHQPSQGPRLERRAAIARRNLWLILGAVVVVAGVVAGLFVALRGGGGTTPKPAASRAAFTFALGKATAVTVSGKRLSQRAPNIAASIQITLSNFYDQAFLDPRSWNGKPPSAMWSVFAPFAQARARADASAFTLAGIGKVTGVKATSSSLDVEVLYDPHGKPTVATATLRFEADVTLAHGGKREQLTATADFLMRNISGKWLIVGYPSANTQVAGGVVGSAPASPTASLSP